MIPVGLLKSLGYSSFRTTFSSTFGFWSLAVIFSTYTKQWWALNKVQKILIHDGISPLSSWLLMDSDEKGKLPRYPTTVTCRCMSRPTTLCLMIHNSHHVIPGQANHHVYYWTTWNRAGSLSCNSLPVSLTHRLKAWICSCVSSQGCTWTGSWWFSAASFYAAGCLEGHTPPDHKQREWLCVKDVQPYQPTVQLLHNCPAGVPNSCTHTDEQLANSSEELYIMNYRMGEF